MKQQMLGMLQYAPSSTIGVRDTYCAARAYYNMSAPNASCVRAACVCVGHAPEHAHSCWVHCRQTLCSIAAVIRPGAGGPAIRCCYKLPPGCYPVISHILPVERDCCCRVQQIEKEWVDQEMPMAVRNRQRAAARDQLQLLRRQADFLTDLRQDDAADATRGRLKYASTGS
jgi:hypothetical protein